MFHFENYPCFISDVSEGDILVDRSSEENMAAAKNYEKLSISILNIWKIYPLLMGYMRQTMHILTCSMCTVDVKPPSVRSYVMQVYIFFMP